MFKRKEYKEKQLRYSIRKVSFGAASVAISALYLLMGSAAVSASEVQAVNGDQTTVTNPTVKDNEDKSRIENNGTTTEETNSAVVTLDKTSLTKLIEEIDGKFTSGKYASKTEDSVNKLKVALEAAKTALSTAKTQAELSQAHANLIVATTKLQTKSEEKKEAPAVDTTNGKATVGKKATNTEKASDSNSIANAGSRDERNGKALDKNNPFRTDANPTNEDTAANQTYTAPAENANLNELADKLKTLPNYIENNKKVQDMDTLGNALNVEKGSVTEIKEFGGWKAVGENGKFAIARKTEAGVFPAYTVNINRTNKVWVREQSFDRNSEYILLLSKLVTKQNRTEPVYDNKPYLENNEPGAQTARSAKWFDGIEKTFKAYATNEGTKVTVSFKTGYTGDNNGSKAKYKVEVFSIENDTEKSIYTAVVSPETTVNNSEMKVVAARDGNARNETFTASGFTKEKIEEKLALPENRPNATGGTFTSREIDLPKGVTSYKVRISLENKHQAGMSYNSSYLQYSLPITGLNFNVDQDTSAIAKNLLQRVYDKLKATEERDIKGKTDETISAYKAQLERVKNLLDGDLKKTQDYKDIVTAVLDGQKALRTDKSKLTASNNKLLDLINENPDPRIGKTPSSIIPYDSAKTEATNAQTEAQTILAQENPDPDVVAAAVSKLNEKLAELKAAKAELVVAATEAQKTKLAADKAKLVEASKEGKTQDSINAYEARYNALKSELDAAVAAANDVANAQENASKVSALEAQEKVTEVLAQLEEAKALLKDKATDAQIAELKKAEKALTPISDDNLGNKKPTSVQNYKNAVAEIQSELTEAQTKVAELLEKAKTDNAAKEEAAQLISKVDALKSKLTDAATLLEDKANTGGLETAKNELKQEAAEEVTAGKTPETVTPYTAAKQAADEAVTEAEGIIANPNASQEAVNAALQKVAEKKAALAAAKKALVEAATTEQKAALAKDAEGLVEASKEGKTPESITAYEAKLQELNNELTAAKEAAKAIAAKGENASKDAAIEAQAKVSAIKAKLADAAALLKDKANTSALETAKNELKQEAAEEVTVGKTPETVTPYTAAKQAADEAVTEAEGIIANPNATQEAVNTALQKVAEKKAALATAKKALVEAATQDQKDDLANAEENLKLADTTGKTKDSIKAYNDEVAKLSDELAAAKQAAKDLVDKGDNAGELEAYRVQAKINKLKSKLAEAAKLLKDIDKSAAKKEVEDAAKNANDAIDDNADLTPEKKLEAKAKVAEAANNAIAAIDQATTEEDVTAAKNAGKFAIEKEAAKVEIEATKAAKEKAIEANEKLSDDEKQAAKDAVAEAATNAIQAIDEAQDQSTVDSAKTTGKETVNAVNPVGKEKALEAVEKAANEKTKAIDANEKLSDAEKKAAKDSVAEEASKAAKAINDAQNQAAVDNAKNAGTTAVEAVNPVGKEKALAAIDKALAEKEKAIDANDKLSDAEKEAAKEKVKKVADEAKKAINEATDQAAVDAKQTEGTTAVEAVNPVGKEKALDAIQKATEDKLAEIDRDDKLSEKEKDKAKAEVAKAAIEAVNAINEATDQASVDAKQTEGTKAVSEVNPVGKDKAKAEIEKSLSEKTNAIDANSDLTDEQKAEAKAKIADEAKKAIDAIDKATTTEDVASAKESGKLAIEKEAAKAEIEAAKAAKEKAIDANPDLTDDEKAMAKERVEEEAEAAKNAIDKATELSDIDKVTETGKDDIKKVTVTSAKEEAKKAIDKALEEKEKAIDARTDLTEEEKEAAKKAAREEAEAAKNAIDKATTLEDINKVLEDGKENIAKINPENLKDKAKKAIDEALAAKEKAIDARTDLTEEEKEAAKKAAREEAEAAKNAIDKATTSEDINKVLEDGKENIAKINPVSAKEEAKKAVEEALANKEKEIDARTDLTPEEKVKAKELAREEAKAAKDAIDKATSIEGIEKALRPFLYQIDQDALVFDRPELAIEDALQASVTGLVKVELGKVITQADIIDKLNLPESITVISIDLPDTTTLGRKFAKVTLRLADGKETTVFVPVEVVESSKENEQQNNTQEDSKPTVVPSNNSEQPTVTQTEDVKENPSNTSQESKGSNQKVLPNTGTGNEVSIFGSAAMTVLASLGILATSKKKEE